MPPSEAASARNIAASLTTPLPHSDMSVEPSYFRKSSPKLDIETGVAVNCALQLGRAYFARQKITILLRRNLPADIATCYPRFTQHATRTHERTHAKTHAHTHLLLRGVLLTTQVERPRPESTMPSRRCSRQNFCFDLGKA